MTRIRFLHGAHDRLQATVRWIAETYRETAAPLIVYAPLREQADALDRLLWTSAATGFIPHCAADSALAGETPVLIASHPAQLDTTPGDAQLLNLSNEIPPNLAHFAQVTEIISHDDKVRLPGRERFRFYREQGYPLESQDLAKQM